MSLIKTGQTSVRLKVRPLAQQARLFRVNPAAASKPLPPRIKLNEEEVREKFVNGSGPGGQKINKTACAVQLKHLPTGIVTTCQETRSQSQNRKIAWRMLAEKVEALEKGPESRTAIKAQEKSRKKASKSKKARRKYRPAKEGQEQDDKDDEEAEEEDVGPEKETVIEQRVG